jgi:hypothetical protein
MTEQCICGNVATVELGCGLMICRSCKFLIDNNGCDAAIDEIKKITSECCEENCCKGQ